MSNTKSYIEFPEIVTLIYNRDNLHWVYPYHRLA